MRSSGNILEIIKKRGFKLSKARKAILELLEKNPKPLSSPDMQILFLRKKINVNKTTVYRELAFLKKQNIIRELQFGDNVKKYELMPDNHHHHIVCVNCEKIEDIELEKDLDIAEKTITQNKKFKILKHSLEFYGICEKCR